MPPIIVHTDPTFQVTKHRSLDRHNDPWVNVVLHTDDGGGEGFIVQVARDLDGTLRPDRYHAYNAYGVKGDADTIRTCVLRLIRAWQRDAVRHGSPHEMSVGRRLVRSETRIIDAVANAMTIR